MADNQTLDRLLRIVACFSAQPAWGVREIARATKLHHATAHRLLKALAGRGLLTFDQTQQRYNVGSELYRIAFHLTRDFDILVSARPHTRQLAATHKETVFIGQFVPEKLEVFIAMGEEAEHPLRIVPQLFQYFPLYAGAMGRAILAFLPDELIKRAIRQSRLKALTSLTITDAQALHTTLATVRQQGYAVSHGERVSDVSAVAVPIFSASGVAGSLSLAMPSARWNPAKEKALAKSVIATARSISLAMGHD